MMQLHSKCSVRNLDCFPSVHPQVTYQEIQGLTLSHYLPCIIADIFSVGLKPKKSAKIKRELVCAVLYFIKSPFEKYIQILQILLNISIY